MDTEDVCGLAGCGGCAIALLVMSGVGLGLFVMIIKFFWNLV